MTSVAEAVVRDDGDVGSMSRQKVSGEGRPGRGTSPRSEDPSRAHLEAFAPSSHSDGDQPDPEGGSTGSRLSGLHIVESPRAVAPGTVKIRYFSKSREEKTLTDLTD